MKKTLLVLLSIVIYLFVLFILIWVSIGINFAVFGRGVGGITAFGSIYSFWLSYKFVRWLWKKYFTSPKP
jgi:hypothetical protein